MLSALTTSDRAAHAASSDALIAALTATRHDRVAISIMRAPDGHIRIAVDGAAHDGRRLLRAAFAALFRNLPPDQAAPEGRLAVRDFQLAGESALRAPLAPQSPRAPDPRRAACSRLRIDFASSHGLLALSGGVVVCSTFCATIEGTIDVTHNAIALHGVVIPLTAVPFPKNVIPQLLLNPDLIGMRYELAGTPSAPVLKLDPPAPPAPGLLRRLFETESADSDR
ncbi:MAG TPA: hypothetical protein VK438_16910 [Xanthobacteraceae bacterium]|nr:hypothetical protein [Xanthobacteraceae bacterium]